MHLLPIQGRSLDDEAAAAELEQSPADLLVLSFTDADLAVLAAAWEQEQTPSLRLINLNRLRHPFSVDRFVETLVPRARFILVRLLGGADYWRYGLDELAAACRRAGVALAVLPGDERSDDRLSDASTLDGTDLAALHAYFQHGGPANLKQVLRFARRHIVGAVPVRPPRPVPPAGRFSPACRVARPDAPHVWVIFYRSSMLAADTAPITALAGALGARGVRVTAWFVASLKDAVSADVLRNGLAFDPPDLIVTTTAFSARGEAGSVLDAAGVPVLQAILSGSDQESWDASPRGLRATDLAMNAVLPEFDGRIGAGVLSFKADAPWHPGLEFKRVVHRPVADRVAHVADLALGWIALARTPRAERRLACVVSDYPGKEGREGYAVGLDTPSSIRAIVAHLQQKGFAVGEAPSDIMAHLAKDQAAPLLSLARYRTLFSALPQTFRQAVETAWGDPSADSAVADGSFQFAVLRLGKVVVAVQPDRGNAETRRGDYHDAALPPRHGYVAFYLWLRHVQGCHAAIQLGAHGTLEWLPGKAVALSGDCAPAVLNGAMPVIYPFIVNNPGEAAQAKRRIGAVTIGHLTPPLTVAGTHGDTADLEHLFDEYAEAVTLDSRRARTLAAAILELAETLDLLPSGVDPMGDPEGALVALDAWLCDVKEMRIGDGLHVFGASPGEEAVAAQLDDIPPSEQGEARQRLIACGPAETAALVAALDGRFVPPGPGGAPSRRRLDVLPTGRNLYGTDPRSVPTRAAWEIGSRLAEQLVARYAQDHGEWPRRVVLDLWGSATMRTGGDDLAQAFALIGVRPAWDHASNRVGGFEILPLARLGRSRVEATLRISGLFRDTFPDQIALYDAAARAVAALDEANEDNPLAESQRSGWTPFRIFGAVPGAYGLDLSEQIERDPATNRDALGALYLDATSHGFGRDGEATAAGDAFREQVARADAFSHTGDLPGQDVLDSDIFGAHEGGFAAAAALLGRTPALYRADTTSGDAPKLRNLQDDVARAVLGRAANPRWIAGQMRHGHGGAISIAESLDALYAFAATTDVVPSRHFDRLFDATLGDDAVGAFLERENPGAVRGMLRKFEAALACGYWVSRRNSTLARLDELRARLTPSVIGR